MDEDRANTVTVVAAYTRRTLPLAAGSLVAVAIGAELVRQPALTRVITAACLGVLALVGAVQWPERTIVSTLLLLPFLAFGRRLLLEYTGWQSTDPTLLIAPAVAGLILVRLFVLERRPLAHDRTSRLVLVVLSITVLQTVNPRGGGLSSSVTALLFAAVPLAWYFVGRELMTQERLRSLFGGVIVVACVVALYGLNQNWNALPSWDLDWVQQTGYNALHVGDVIRPFGTFSSSAEYALYLGVGIVIAFAFALRRLPLFLPAVPLLAVALFYSSARSVLVTTCLAAIVLLAARTGRMGRTVVVLGVCFAALALFYTFGRGAIQQTAAASSDPLVSHQLGGLADPFNSKESTLPSHLALFQNGFRSGLLDPVGHGITATNIAGATVGGDATTASTEIDISNAFVSLGTVGGLAYLVLALLLLVTALRLAVGRRDAVSLAALGTLIVVLGQWLNGGLYAISPLVWLIAGSLVAREHSRT